MKRSLAIVALVLAGCVVSVNQQDIYITMHEPPAIYSKPATSIPSAAPSASASAVLWTCSTNHTVLALKPAPLFPLDRIENLKPTDDNRDAIIGYFITYFKDLKDHLKDIDVAVARHNARLRECVVVK